MEKISWISREALYSKCYGIVADQCAEGLITEEEAEQQWDKMELMSKSELARLHNRLKEKKYGKSNI